jgi:threonine dehydrogenase-like Zn-dependent dehydrogenase
LQGRPHLDRLVKTAELRFREPQSYTLDGDLFREQTILGNRVYTPHDIDRALALLADDGESFRSLISDIVPLTEAAAAFDRLRSGQGVKVVVTLEAA